MHHAYMISMKLTQVYNKTTDKRIALINLAKWYDAILGMNCRFFNSVINTMPNNYGNIMNCFDHRGTNAGAESFNTKVKSFRSQFRGVRDISYFIFRLTKLFA